ncbi:hypothetical protein PWA69_001087 [Campylobacter coli]|nr:hypothetical protein [Campylobacter coli]
MEEQKNMENNGNKIEKVRKNKGNNMENKNQKKLNINESLSDFQKHIEYEKQFLFKLIPFLKTFKLNIFNYNTNIGNLALSIGNILDIRSDDFIFACYYANMSFLSMEHLLRKETLNEEELKTFKRHIYLSADFLEKINLPKSAEIVLYHHEKPNAQGYLRKQSYPKESAIINIAEEFTEAILPREYRPQYTLKEALQLALEPYKNSIFFDNREYEIIKKKLTNSYLELV